MLFAVALDVDRAEVTRLESAQLSVPLGRATTLSLCKGTKPDARLAARVHSAFMRPAITGSVRLPDNATMYNTDALISALSERADLGVSGLMHTMLTVFRRYIASAPPDDLQADLGRRDNAAVDAALEDRARAFWLMHWFGTWVGDEMVRTPRNFTEMVMEFVGCAPPLELWSVSHGISWHYMVHTTPWSTLAGAAGADNLRRLSSVLCHRALMRWYPDCFHGIGHGIVHARRFLDHERAPYSQSSQFFHVPFSGDDFDAMMRLCGAFPFVEAAGCADGISHAVFVFWTPADYPSASHIWCSDRVWAASCYRGMLHYGPLALLGVAKSGAMASLEFFGPLKLHFPVLYTTLPVLVDQCMSLPAETHAACLFGIVGSGWNRFISSSWREGFRDPIVGASSVDLIRFCSDARFQNNTALLDTCLLPFYVTLFQRKRAKGEPAPQVLAVQPCQEHLAKFGARCTVEASEIAFGAKMLPMFACHTSGRCPHQSAISDEQRVARSHREDGH